MNRGPARQRGVALLVALLVVALATIVIATLLDRGELALARTRNVLRAEQAQAYAQGLELFAAQILLTTWDQGADSNASPWALPLPPQPVPGGIISATLRDLDGCFNLNNLSPQATAGADWLRIFQSLLIQRGVDPQLAAAVRAWLDGEANASATEANHYLALPVPYRPRSGLFAHVSELRLVRGVSGEVYARLVPHVCALPPDTRLNVNTASVPVLQALGLSQADAERVWQGGLAHYASVDEFIQDTRDPALGAKQALLTTQSHWFLARGDIVLDAVPFTFYSLIGRLQGMGIRVFERSRGSDDALVAPAPLAAAGAHDGMFE